MTYANTESTRVYSSIVNFIKATQSDVHQQSLFAEILKLDNASIFDISTEGNNLLHDALSLCKEDSDKCCFVINALVKRAMHIDITTNNKRKAVAFLLMHTNKDQLSPYYHALFIHADSTIVNNISDWLAFSRSNNYLSLKDYISIHLNPNNLLKLAAGGYAQQLNYCLNELTLVSNTTKVKQKSLPWDEIGVLETLENSLLTDKSLNKILTANSNFFVTVDAYENLSFQHTIPDLLNIFQAKNKLQQNIFEIALSSGCSKTINIVFKRLNNYNFLQKDAFGEIFIHKLIYNYPSDVIVNAFTELCVAAKADLIKPNTIKNILFIEDPRGYRLLDKAMRHGNPDILKSVLNTANIAFNEGWISATEYKDMLTGNVKYTFNFSALHQAISFTTDGGFLIYLNNLIEATVNGALTLKELTSLLLQPNYKHLLPIHKVINCSSSKKIQFLCYLLQCVFSKDAYLLILKYPINLEEDRAFCSYPKSRESIYAFLRFEEKRLRTDALPRKLNVLHKENPAATLDYKSFVLQLNKILQFAHANARVDDDYYSIPDYDEVDESIISAPCTSFKFFATDKTSDKGPNAPYKKKVNSPVADKHIFSSNTMK